jgi:hypothetical protein
VATPRQPGRSPVLTSATRRPPGPSARVVVRFPGPFSRLWSCLQMVPVSDGESISTPPRGRRARVCRHSFLVCSVSTGYPQDKPVYPHLKPVFHHVTHSLSTVTGRSSANTAMP